MEFGAKLYFREVALMPTRTHEQTINTSLGEVLQEFGQGWHIRSEHVGRVFEEGGRPDILIEKSDG